MLAFCLDWHRHSISTNPSFIKINSVPKQAPKHPPPKTKQQQQKSFLFDLNNDIAGDKDVQKCIV